MTSSWDERGVSQNGVEVVPHRKRWKIKEKEKEKEKEREKMGDHSSFSLSLSQCPFWPYFDRITYSLWPNHRKERQVWSLFLCNPRFPSAYHHHHLLSLLISSPFCFYFLQNPIPLLPFSHLVWPDGFLSCDLSLCLLVSRERERKERERKREIDRERERGGGFLCPRGASSG